MTGHGRGHRDRRQRENLRNRRLTLPKTLDVFGSVDLADCSATRRGGAPTMGSARAVRVDYEAKPITSCGVRDLVEQRTGVRPSDSAVRRWRKDGVAGVRLHGQWIGGRWYSTSVEVDAFLEQLQAQPEVQP